MHNKLNMWQNILKLNMYVNKQFNIYENKIFEMSCWLTEKSCKRKKLMDVCYLSNVFKAKII